MSRTYVEISVKNQLKAGDYVEIVTRTGVECSGRIYAIDASSLKLMTDSQCCVYVELGVIKTVRRYVKKLTEEQIKRYISERHLHSTLYFSTNTNRADKLRAHGNSGSAYQAYLTVRDSPFWGVTLGYIAK